MGWEFGHPLHPISLRQQQLALQEIASTKIGLYRQLPGDISHRIGVTNACRIEEYWDGYNDRFGYLMYDLMESDLPESFGEAWDYPSWKHNWCGKLCEDGGSWRRSHRYVWSADQNRITAQ